MLITTCMYREENMILDVFSYTSAGGRSHNEDTIAYRTENGHGLFVLADGLGGHSRGEVASECVAGVMLNDWSPDSVDSGEGDKELSRLDWLCNKFREANRAVLDLQKKQGRVMKSTAVALAIDDNKACWAHAGDSRLYYIRQGRINHITWDHSVAFKKWRAGEITRWQINTDEDQSALLRTLGSEDRSEPEPGPSNVEIAPGDAFMLCSDGVWEYLHDTEVLVDYLKSLQASDWGTRLLMRVMDRIDGTNDNLSIITILVE